MADEDPFAPHLRPEDAPAGEDPFAAHLKPEAPAHDDRGFFRRAADTIKEGAHAVGTVGSDFIHHPIGTITNPSKRREFERGVDQMVTLGYGQKAARAIEDTNFGKAMNRVMGAPEGGMSEQQEAADAAAAPGYRTAGGLVGSVLPGAATALAGGAGKLASPITSRLATGTGKLASKAGVLAPLVAGAGGAAKGIAEYEAAAPGIAALSADAAGHRHEAAHAAATDPMGLLTAGATGAVGPGLEAAGGQARKFVEHSPAAEADNLMAGVAAGDGTHGRATVKAAKLLDRSKENAVELLRTDKELRTASAKPAKEALPIFHRKLDEVGAKLDPHYDTIDKVTGGVSVQNLANVLDDEIQRLGKTPLNEQYINAVDGIKRSLLKAWAPSMSDELAAQKRITDMGLTSHKEVPDVMIPTREVRAMVTRLQKRGTDVINALNPGESSQMKVDMAKMMKDFIDSDLDIAAEKSPEAAAAVEGIRGLNKQYSALATMADAIEQRGWKENTGGTSLAGHGHNLLKGGGLLGAGMLAMQGHYGPAAAALVGPYALPLAGKAVKGATAATANFSRSPAYAASVKRLAQAAKAATSVADFTRAAVSAGLPLEDARRIYEAAHGGQQQGASP